MIEKLKPHPCINANGVVYGEIQPDYQEMTEKINELVDIINELQESQNTYWTDIAELKKELQIRAENMQDRMIGCTTLDIPESYKTDPYAEQRKWIGKLCRFWDEKEEEKVFGILTTIDSDCGLSDMCPYWNDTTKNWFEHCEPVKPDDDIIYKGE